MNTGKKIFAKITKHIFNKWKSVWIDGTATILMIGRVSFIALVHTNESAFWLLSSIWDQLSGLKE